MITQSFQRLESTVYDKAVHESFLYGDWRVFVHFLACFALETVKFWGVAVRLSPPPLSEKILRNFSYKFLRSFLKTFGQISHTNISGYVTLWAVIGETKLRDVRPLSRIRVCEGINGL